MMRDVLLIVYACNRYRVSAAEVAVRAHAQMRAYHTAKQAHFASHACSLADVQHINRCLSDCMCVCEGNGAGSSQFARCRLLQ